MTEEKKVNDDALDIEEEEESLNPQEVESDETETAEGEEETVPKAEFEKIKQIAENQRIRAEKAEKASKKAPEVEASTLSNKDMLAILREGVDDDDIPEVQAYAKIKGITVAEALKTSLVRSMLDEKKEERKTAEVTAAGNKRPSSKSSSGQELLDKARRTGQLPDSEEELQKLVKAQFEK
jgi:hypothetical protein